VCLAVSKIRMWLTGETVNPLPDSPEYTIIAEQYNRERRKGFVQEVLFGEWLDIVLLFLFLVFCGLCLMWVYDFVTWWCRMIGPSYAPTVILSIVLAMVLYGRAIWIKSRNRGTAAWRCFCMANAVLLTLCGWMGLPEERHQRLLDGVVQAQIRLDSLRSINTSAGDQHNATAAESDVAAWKAAWDSRADQSTPLFEGPLAFVLAGLWLAVSIPVAWLFGPRPPMGPKAKLDERR
jgi:hypothetical protein